MALSQTLSRDLARPLVALNRGERRRYPQIVIGRMAHLDAAGTHCFNEAAARERRIPP